MFKPILVGRHMNLYLYAFCADEECFYGYLAMNKAGGRLVNSVSTFLVGGEG
jgi:hypothetical protein